jgi:LmbE family N-acetylglucosaminyl deacetylase
MFGVLGLLGLALWATPSVARGTAPRAPAPRPLTLRALGRRILVLAPHPDDEVLGAGGVIDEAMRAGAQVWVAVATSGESSVTAAVETLHVSHPRPADFARLGRIRRNESRAGTRLLGLPSSHLIFLGYADGSLTPLWLGAWNCRHPRVSGGTHVARTLLASAFDPHAAYCAPDLLADLERLLRRVRPDTVILPDLADQHPDHAGLAAFTWAAVLAYDRARPAGAPIPRLYGYLVHYPGWPTRWGADPDAPESVPTPWTGGQAVWLRVPLTRAATAAKARALARYRSALVVARPFLTSFIRADELFTCRPLVETLGRRWRPLAEIRRLAPSVFLVDDAPVPGIAIADRYAGPPIRFAARSSGQGRLELRLTGRGWREGGLGIRLYAWRVAPTGPDVRLEVAWADGRSWVSSSGPPVTLARRPIVAGSALTWSFDAGDGVWQVAASLVDGSGRTHITPWLAVTAGVAPRPAPNCGGLSGTGPGERR